MALSTELTEDLGTEWNESGRLSTVTDAAEIRQSLVLGIFYDADLSAVALDEGSIEEQRGSIEDAVRDNPKSQPPTRVTVSNVNYDEKRIDYEIRTRRVQLPFTVTPDT